MNLQQQLGAFIFIEEFDRTIWKNWITGINAIMHLMFAIGTESANIVTAGHLPRETTRVTEFLLNLVATIIFNLSSVHYRRSSLIQDRVCIVTIRLSVTLKHV